MSAATWHTLAHLRHAPPPADWREQLAARLGQRPRRMGTFAELAVYGALECLACTGTRQLPAGMLLRLASVGGPHGATQALLAQSQSALPLPFGFMQSQPAYALAALALALGWQGDARFVVAADQGALLQLAHAECLAARADGVLLGWVEEELSTEWWWLQAAAADGSSGGLQCAPP